MTVDPDKKGASGDHLTCSQLPETVDWLNVKIAWKKSMELLPVLTFPHLSYWTER